MYLTSYKMFFLVPDNGCLDSETETEADTERLSSALGVPLINDTFMPVLANEDARLESLSTYYLFYY